MTIKGYGGIDVGYGFRSERLRRFYPFDLAEAGSKIQYSQHIFAFKGLIIGEDFLNSHP